MRLEIFTNIYAGFLIRNRKKKGSQKHVVAIDMVLIVGSLIVLAWLVGFSSPLVISPIADYESVGSDILFYIENADKILIDNDMDFVDADEYLLREGFKLSFEPGIYYWKAVGVMESEVRSLTIVDAVVLNVIESKNGSYEVVNAGSIGLNVEIYNNESEFVENVSLSPYDSIEIEENKYVGGFDGK